MTVNRQILLASRPVGEPASDDFELRRNPLPEVRDGEALVRVRYLSLDPAMRGWMREGKSYIPPVGLGEVMRSLGAGEVVESRTSEFAPGDRVVGALGWQDYACLPAKDLQPIPDGVPYPLALGPLGMTGLTAYFGLLDVGKPNEGDTVVISAAAGAVGSVAGQIAKIHGCRVVGIAGGPDKCGWITDELGFDAAIDYKATKDLSAALKEACPDGIDVFFDNVGGDILDAALARLARGARVVICGAISQYNAEDGVRGPSNYLSLLVNRASMAGFVIFDYAPRYGEALAALGGWLREGRLRSREQIVDDGLEAAPETLLELFRGGNTGKLLLRVLADEEPAAG